MLMKNNYLWMDRFLDAALALTRQARNVVSCLGGLESHARHAANWVRKLIRHRSAGETRHFRVRVGFWGLRAPWAGAYSKASSAALVVAGNPSKSPFAPNSLFKLSLKLSMALLLPTSASR